MGQCLWVQPAYFQGTGATSFKEPGNHPNPYEYMGCNSYSSDDPPVLQKLVAPRKQKSGQPRKMNPLLSKKDRGVIKGKLAVMRDQMIPWKDIAAISSDDPPVLQKLVPIYTVPRTTAPRKQKSGQPRKKNPLLSKKDRGAIKGKLAVMRDQKIPWKDIAAIINEQFGEKLDSEDGFNVPCLEMMHHRNLRKRNEEFTEKLASEDGFKHAKVPCLEKERIRVPPHPLLL